MRLFLGERDVADCRDGALLPPVVYVVYEVAAAAAAASVRDDIFYLLLFRAASAAAAALRDASVATDARGLADFHEDGRDATRWSKMFVVFMFIFLKELGQWLLYYDCMSKTFSSKRPIPFFYTTNSCILY